MCVLCVCGVDNVSIRSNTKTFSRRTCEVDVCKLSCEVGDGKTIVLSQRPQQRQRLSQNNQKSLPIIFGITVTFCDSFLLIPFVFFVKFVLLLLLLFFFCDLLVEKAKEKPGFEHLDQLIVANHS